MRFAMRAIFLTFFALACPAAMSAEPISPLSNFSMGRDSAPVTIDEYASLTCTHCGDFTLKILPELQKRYIDTGIVRFVMHEFPLNAVSLKASAVAHCMPKDQYLPFVKTLYDALSNGNFGGADSETKLYQYAALGGLPMEKAKACANDTKLQDALIAQRTEAAATYKIEATPTFVINKGADIITGAQSIENFASAIDRQLAKKR